MTNFEYYKDDILKIVEDNGTPCFNIKTDKISRCRDTKCIDCVAGHKKPCWSELFKFLYEEHIEKPKLTKKERMFCEVVGTGWIARDKTGTLYIYHGRKPSKDLAGSGVYWYNSVNGRAILKANRIDWVGADIFKFITWDDEEPWAVEDLLKLEVIDE